MPRGIYIRKPITEETREILSKSHLGIKTWNTGLHKLMPRCSRCEIELKDRRSLKCRSCAMKDKTFGKISKKKGKHYPHLQGINNALWKGGSKVTREKNKDKIRFWCLQRISRKKGSIGNHTLDDWEELKKNYNYMCLCCKRFEPEIKLTEDHIIPLNKGGSNYIENIQPICGSCNSRKHIKIIDYRPTYQGMPMPPM